MRNVGCIAFFMMLRCWRQSKTPWGLGLVNQTRTRIISRPELTLNVCNRSPYGLYPLPFLTKVGHSGRALTEITKRFLQLFQVTQGITVPKCRVSPSAPSKNPIKSRKVQKALRDLTFWAMARPARCREKRGEPTKMTVFAAV